MYKTLCFHPNDEQIYWFTVDLEIRHFRLVRAIAGAGSLTAAGVVLHLTQSALSHQLSDIESRLGTPLFLRVGKRMVLTPAGERVLESAGEVLTAIETTEKAVRSLCGTARGLLRIATECYTCYHWLPALITRYRNTHPHVDLRIEPSATSDPIAHLVDGRLDVAIVSDPVKDRRVVTRRLFDDEMVAIMEPRHPLASRPFVVARDFATETLVAYSPMERSTFCQRYLAASRVAPASFQYIQLTEAVIELVKAGLGVSVLARWAVAPAVAAGTIRAVPIRPAYRRTWSAASLKDMTRVPHVREFVELVAGHPPFREPAPQRAARQPRRNQTTTRTLPFTIAPSRGAQASSVPRPSRARARRSRGSQRV
jgi:LysR family transcriptional regulator for metE and metH